MQLLKTSVLAAALLGLPLTTALQAPAFAGETSHPVRYAPVASGDYIIDANHSIIGFSIRHLEINWVEGRFKDFQGTIHFDASDISRSSVEFTAQIDSIDTGIEARDKHLRTADFFDVAKYPQMTFRSTKVEKRGRERYLLTGDLTLKGVTKSVSLPFTMTGAIKDSRGNVRFGVDARTRIVRQDYGITYGKAMAVGGYDVGNEVDIHLQLEAMQPAPKSPE